MDDPSLYGDFHYDFANGLLQDLTPCFFVKGNSIVKNKESVEKLFFSGWSKMPRCKAPKS